MPYDETADGARQLWEAIPDMLREGLEAAPRDFGALECLANDPLYAKPDSLKFFVLWEARLAPGDGIKIETVKGGWKHHSWVYSLFTGPDFVRFPFNILDSDLSSSVSSISWATITGELFVEGCEERLLKLPRWSTASRSCLALIPVSASNLEVIPASELKPWARIPVPVPTLVGSEPAPHVPEWNARGDQRFCTVVTTLGDAVAQTGVELARDLTRPLANDNKCRWRLYSVKTGVKYVGSKDEATLGGKHRLETNSSMAMVRSGVIQDFPILDDTFAVQTEVLTITAPMGDGDRDGFQVRDLSAMKPDLVYMPGQAIPYARKAFDGFEADQVEQQCEFWRRTFAVPLGRAKARLLLNFGLVHMSANAQNFLVGFKKNSQIVDQFLARDIGDTSWHDVYLERYFDGASLFASSVFASYQDEDRKAFAHTLRKPPTGNYPAPQIMRLGTYQTLSHDFGKVLLDQGWTRKHLYRFSAGILEGFRNYIEAALFDENLLYDPAGPNILKDELENLAQDAPARANRIADEYRLYKDYGVAGKFPPYPQKVTEYKAKVLEAVALTFAIVFEKAKAVSQLGACLDADDFNALGDEALDVLINAEELLMCAGLETRLGLVQGQRRDPRIAETLKSLLLNERPWPPVVPATRDVDQ